MWNKLLAKLFSTSTLIRRIIVEFLTVSRNEFRFQHRRNCLQICRWVHRLHFSGEEPHCLFDELLTKRRVISLTFAPWDCRSSLSVPTKILHEANPVHMLETGMASSLFAFRFAMTLDLAVYNLIISKAQAAPAGAVQSLPASR